MIGMWSLKVGDYPLRKIAVSRQYGACRRKEYGIDFMG